MMAIQATSSHTSSDEPDRCPKCGKEEDIKQVCKHCGYEYEETDNDLSGWSIVFGTLSFIGIGIWLAITIYVWIAESGASNPSTLIDVLVSQYDFVSRLRVW